MCCIRRPSLDYKPSEGLFGWDNTSLKKKKEKIKKKESHSDMYPAKALYGKPSQHFC